VKEAIRGLRMFYQSKGAKLVPIREMVDAITVNRKAKASLGGSCLPPSCVPQPALPCLPEKIRRLSWWFEKSPQGEKIGVIRAAAVGSCPGSGCGLPRQLLGFAQTAVGGYPDSSWELPRQLLGFTQAAVGGLSRQQLGITQAALGVYPGSSRGLSRQQLGFTQAAVGGYPGWELSRRATMLRKAVGVSPRL
jgi:hypothetical protein